ncbi:Cytochrome b561, bacterial/Ni-hydrogenase [Acididesulfobacillus acetoxydans]|uniref:Cytochrome b561, bacterial/Ni-hydrogenase n=1 Tax=Acididesulfobacillus acetoxydans TaxID=1561005 RepID=A0A8S0X3K9_9FIRM|nr:cytochrome b/b6 domain-containing protein [Acididesulfobacillus acetoxydans]CAA7600180.1 Cytochrome b561, bacterial/Ni-hydrogenase [Acididesulfobacillus acetoxydans]CEJ09558.1 Ni/Fe-hydrogenase, b-type cytochrome subunit [Acididesulfobacillus acetoxydans]
METHHLPQRVAHAVNLTAMVVLAATGFYLHRPAAYGQMGTIRYVHYVAAFVLLANLALRIYYAFLGRYRDYWEFKPNVRSLPQQVKYYLFLSNKDAKQGLYNPLQRLAYLAVILMIILQALTGFAMGWPQGTMSFLVGWLGLAEIRSIHYLFTWLFITFLVIHLYLVFTESPQAFWEMFTGRQRKESRSVGKNMAHERI